MNTKLIELKETCLKILGEIEDQQSVENVLGSTDIEYVREREQTTISNCCQYLCEFMEPSLDPKILDEHAAQLLNLLS